ncbi:MAG: MopE-related protein [Myxococcota bacterium]
MPHLRPLRWLLPALLLTHVTSSGCGSEEPPLETTPPDSPTDLPETSPASSPTVSPDPGTSPSPTNAPASPTGSTPDPTLDFSLSSTAIAFGEVMVGNTQQASLTLLNDGEGSVQLRFVLEGNPADAFAYPPLSSPLPAALETGGRFEVQLQFNATTVGDAEGTFTVIASDADESVTLEVALSGVGIPPVLEDADSDGYNIDEGDCNDGDKTIYPNAPETCDLKDNDCDKEIDEDGESLFYLDADQDGYGIDTDTVLTCLQPAGYATLLGDCDDVDDTVYPMAPEQCDGQDNDCDELVDEEVQKTFYTDADGDEHGNVNAPELACTQPPSTSTLADDCDDADANNYPGNLESCDGKDNSCEGNIDEGLALIVSYPDQDGDTFGDSLNPQEDCKVPAGRVTQGGDCNDALASVYPNAVESCDSIDNDCDGSTDEESITTWYTDADKDGFGDAATQVVTCTPNSNQVSKAGDCNDQNASAYPGATEKCDLVDNDCDTKVDEGVSLLFYADVDGDTYGDPNATAQGCSAPAGYVSNNLDCNDSSTQSNPGKAELCDGIDNDCDGTIDDGVLLLFYVDSDNDGYGNASQSVEACSAPSGYVSDKTDCNDRDATVSPGATESCDLKDNDCDSQLDEGVKTTFYEDADKDGVGNTSKSVSACTAPAGYVSKSGDCNDADATVYTGAPEACDGKDNDCDSQVDEAGSTTFYRDVDGDKYGDVAITYVGCSAPSGYVSDNTDCNDRNAAINPGAAEACDGIDQNCNNQIDEGVKTAYYLDADKDTYGDSTSVLEACKAPSSSYVTRGGDCDDLSASVYPGATETCNNKDDDCDGTLDEGVKTTFYKDADGDGYGSSATTAEACVAPSGYVSNATDCDDTKNQVNPAASEKCNGRDDDCDGQLDEGVKSTFYLDGDGDGYGLAASTVQACSAPVGYAALSGDCNDSDNKVYPNATESCDLKDNDCDGSVDEGVTQTFYYDADKDGYGDPDSGISACTAPSSRYVTNGLDCNDTNANIKPGATETCNSVDDDCDGQTDESGSTVFYRDQDSDTYGTSTTTTTACSAPSGYVSRAGDCNDTNNKIYPGALEVRGDGVDQDCNGSDLPHVDLNLDGWPDLVVANHYSSSTAYATNSRVYWGSSRGPTATNFTDLPTIGPMVPCVADFNKDGYQDVAFASYYNGSSYISTSYLYFGSSSGFSTTRRTSFPTSGATDCSVGDVNGDGHLDLAFAAYYDGDYVSVGYVYYGTASGPSVTGPFTFSGNGGYAVHLEDLNGDGKAELIQSNHYDSSNGGGYNQNSYIYWGATSGLSVNNRTALPTSGSWHKAVVSDLDGNGFKDVVFTSYYNNSTYDVSSSIYWGSSTGFSSSNVTKLPTMGSAEAAASDLDGDGYIDLVFSSHYSTSGYSTYASVYWGSSRGFSTSNRTTLPTYMSHYMAIDDLNLDGDMDLIFSGHYSGSSYATSNYVYMGGVGGYSTSRSFALPGNGAVAVATYDMNLDGYSEVFVSGYYNGSSYNTDGYMYWGSSSGYSSVDRVALPQFGGRRMVVVGNPE